jgi:triacylglycerol lipase
MLARPRLPRPTLARRPTGDVAIVLVHGYLCLSRTYYWHGLLPVRRELTAAGCPVIAGRLPRTGPVAARAHHLARLIARLPYRRLVLVGHSMGGLDARYAASRLDPERRISHVVTVGTPHRGTAIADRAIRDTVWLSRLLRFVDRGALRDLTLEGAHHLDSAMPDRPDVEYVALAGAITMDRLAGTLRRFGEQIGRDDGPNDGLVAVRSALRGRAGIMVTADHLGLIGHGPPDRGRGQWTSA